MDRYQLLAVAWMTFLTFLIVVWGLLMDSAAVIEGIDFGTALFENAITWNRV